MTILNKNSADNINLIKQLANKTFPDSLLLAGLTVAQAILEGGLASSPPSQLALKYCNLFGMKPGFIRTGTAVPGIVYLPTNEYIPGKGMIRMNQPFLANASVEDSINQHKELLTGLNRYHNLSTVTTFEEIAHMIYDDGYATDPNYPNELINIYERYVK